MAARHDALKASRPEWQKKRIIARGLLPVLDTPEQFSRLLNDEAKLGRDVVVASGLYPDVK
jgi:hypothetical protein